MTFPRRLLTSGEEVVVDLRPHWAFLGWPLVATTAAAALAVGIDVTFPHAPVGVGYVLLGVVGVAALWLAGRTLRWVTTSLVLTTTRIVERSGVVGRRALEIRLDRINELSYHQSLGGRLARTGEVMVEMGGEKGTVMFEHVPRPSAFQSLITEQMSALRDGRRVRDGSGPLPDGPGAPHHADTPPTGGPAVPLAAPPGPGSVPAPGSEAAGAGPSVADRLMQLGELRRRGIVSAAEFEAKKAELLEQL
ncbi:MAG TPA: PH domain-containing protein [Acidimicrobiales bacterium]|nr:PH domain-containing protein [Acidimicrobiales bacterium]